MPLAISILGVTGKMGKRVLMTAAEDPEICIVGGLARKQSPLIGKDLGDVLELKPLHIPIESCIEQVLTPCAVAVDFSTREATLYHVQAAKKAKKALVIGTTGHSMEELLSIEKAAQEIPIVMSPNFSLGIALCMNMVSSLAQTLFGKCYIDIIEEHHIHKKDQPSGTALALAEAVGKGKIVHGTPAFERSKEDIAIHSLRAGDTIGEHQIRFECGHERIEIKHIAHSRDVFAHGALLAAKLLVRKPAGLYTLKDLFL